ncbi:hypothetical protein CDAR_174231 [Caerostris darwini]|uniref:Uncharacterized protein n=1 Tax=Caerostris darwini TaxID=1538125 RepID=A0AAV4VI98_9ARAC|nr:hypothetical protein CDAR_174231 [Caerostris darwini]
MESDVPLEYFSHSLIKQCGCSSCGILTQLPDALSENLRSISTNRKASQLLGGFHGSNPPNNQERKGDLLDDEKLVKMDDMERGEHRHYGVRFIY